MVFAELGRQDREEVALHLVVAVESVAACLLVFLYLGLKLCDPRGYGLQVLHGARVQHPYLAAQLLEAQRQATIDDAYHTPPGVEAVQVFGAPEDGLGRAREASREKSPDGRIEGLLFGFVHEVARHVVERFFNDSGLVVLLRPLQDIQQSRYLAPEITLHSGLPSWSAFASVPTHFVLAGHFVVVDLLV